MSRLLVVGASGGIGAAVARLGHAEGADVLGTSRRGAAAATTGGRPLVACDVRDPASVRRLVRTALDLWGGLDGVVYTAGVSPLAPVLEASPALWAEVFETNVVGAASVLAATRSTLLETGGTALFLTSTMVGRPWPLLGPYSASRAALEEMLRGVRGEHPELRVTTAVIGPTRTDFRQQWDPLVGEQAVARWRADGYLHGTARSLDPDDVARGLLAVLASPVRTDHVEFLPAIRAPGWVDR